MIAATSCASFGCAHVARARSPRTSNQFPCALHAETEDTPPRLLNGFNSWSPQTDLIEAESGYPQLEHHLGVILVHMSGFYGVSPEFGFITEDGNPNAFATSYSATGNQFGTVAFGRGLLGMEINKPHGDFAVLAICAHEFGHIRQYRDNYISNIEQRFPRYCVELHADFLAGAFIAYWKRMMSNDALLRIGDTWSGLGSSDFNNPGSHGTTLQRVGAIEAGFFFRDSNPATTIADIMETGLEHVAQYA